MSIELKQAAQQAEAKTDEPVGYMNAGQLYELQQGRAPYGYIYPQSGVGADIELFTHPAPGVSDDVVRDAERYRWLRSLEHCNEAWCFIGSGNANSNLDAAIDAAMLAAKSTRA